MNWPDITPPVAAIAHALGGTVFCEADAGNDHCPLVSLPDLKMALRASYPWHCGRDRYQRLSFAAEIPTDAGRWQRLHQVESVTVSVDRAPRAAAADIRRRLIEPAQAHARAALQAERRRAAVADQERVFREDIAQALGTPLEYDSHGHRNREAWTAPGLQLDTWSVTKAAQGEPFEAHVQLYSPHALRLIARIIAADQTLKPKPAR